jgi:hypothetical protein
VSVVLRAFYATTCFILHKHTHEFILGSQQLLNADRRAVEEEAVDFHSHDQWIPQGCQGQHPQWL